MRWLLLFGLMVLTAAACSNRNLLGEEIWSDEKLSRTELGFGWNYETKGKMASARNLDVLVKPDNSYEIQINEYRSDMQTQILSKINGQLDGATAGRVRRSLAQLRSKEGADLYTSLPNCPDWGHPAIQYYVGFKTAEEPAVTVIESNCDTPETVEARNIVKEAFMAFPQLDPADLIAGSTEL